MSDSPFLQRIGRISPYLLLAVGFVVLISRSAYSFCWVDESFYLALADELYKGAAPFIDEWHPAQVYAPLLLPLYAAYVTATGGTDGIVYFFRLVYLLVAFAVSLLAYKVLSRDFGRVAATAAAVSYLFYIRASIQGMSYYSLCTTFFLLGLLCAWRAWLFARDDDGSASTARVAYPVASGAFFALAVCCNPYVVFILFAAFAVAVAIAAKRRCASILTPFAWGICGCVIVACCYLMFLLSRSDPAALLSNLVNVFDSHDENLTYAQRIPDYLNSLVVSPVHLTGAVALAAFLAAWRGIRRPVNARMSFAVLVASCTLFGIAVHAAMTASLHPNKIFIAFAESAVSCYFLSCSLRLKDHPEVLLFWIPGLLLSLAWQFSSNTRVCGVIIGYSIVAMGAFITLAHLAKELRENSAARTHEGKLAVSAAALTYACVAAVVLLTCGIRLASIYSDCPLSEMDTTIESGPAAGLATSSAHATEYEGVRELLSQVNDDGGIYIAPMAPWGYLEVEGEVAAPSAWNIYLDESKAEAYFEEQGHERPEWILVTNDNLGESVNIIAGRVCDFPALEVYEDTTAQLRAYLGSSEEYAPVSENEYGVLYKRASEKSYFNAAG